MFINITLKRIFFSCAIYLTKCFIVSDLSKQTINAIHSRHRPWRKSMKRAERDKADFLLSQAHASTPSEFWFTQSEKVSIWRTHPPGWLSTSWLLSLLKLPHGQWGLVYTHSPGQDLWGTDHGFEPQCYKTKLEHPSESSLFFTLLQFLFFTSQTHPEAPSSLSLDTWQR